jgi:hypothetical protein
VYTGSAFLTHNGGGNALKFSFFGFPSGTEMIQKGNLDPLSPTTLFGLTRVLHATCPRSFPRIAIPFPFPVTTVAKHYHLLRGPGSSCRRNGGEQ